MTKKPQRPRRARREEQRDLRRVVRRREGLARALPGGARDAPIDLVSSAEVENRARDTPCVQCGGALEIKGDRAESTPRGVLRAIDVVCRLCHAPRTLWLRVAPPSAN